MHQFSRDLSVLRNEFLKPEQVFFRNKLFSGTSFIFYFRNELFLLSERVFSPGFTFGTSILKQIKSKLLNKSYHISVPCHTYKLFHRIRLLSFRLSRPIFPKNPKYLTDRTNTKCHGHTAEVDPEALVANEALQPGKAQGENEAEAPVKDGICQTRSLDRNQVLSHLPTNSTQSWSATSHKT